MLLQPDVLDIVLTHCSHLIGVRELCNLLCTSTATAASVALNSRARAVQFSPKKLQQANNFNKWLLQHGQLLESLEFKPDLPWSTESDPLWTSSGLQYLPPSLRDEGWNVSASAEDVCCECGSQCEAYKPDDDNAAAGGILAQGLAAAHAAGRLDTLHSFTSTAWDANVPTLLQSLPSGLTRLDINWTDSIFSQCGYSGRAKTAPLVEALSRLRGLQSLRVHKSWVVEFEGTSRADAHISSRAFSHLVHLTQLDTSGLVLRNKHFRRLPASLQVLRIKDWHAYHEPAADSEDEGEDGDDWRIDFSPMTSLTELQTGILCWGGRSAADAEPVKYIRFPPGLRRLWDGYFEDVGLGVLLRPELSTLQRLDSQICVKFAARIAPLMPGLTHLAIAVETGGEDEDEGGDVEGATAEAAAAARALPEDGALGEPIDALFKAGVAGVVREFSVDLPWSLRFVKSSASFGVPLVQQLARLPNLSALHVGVPLSCGAGPLSALPGRLTMLSIDKHSLDGPALLQLPAACAEGLPWLQRLKLHDAARHHLAVLQPAECACFFEGLAGLAQLHRLSLQPLAKAELQGEAVQILAAATQLSKLRWKVVA